MGLWCGHAVLPFSGFDLVFLFRLLDQVALALVMFFELSLVSLLFFLSSLSPGSVCSWFGCDFSESSLLGFCSELLFLFSSGFLRPPGSGVRCRSCSLFLLEVFLSAFEISFSGRPFFFLGVEFWPGPFVLALCWVLWTLLLALGRFIFSVFVWAISCSASFFLCMWFRQNIGVSGGPQVVLILGLSAGAAAPCLAHAGACGLFLCGLLGEVFCSVFLSSACGFLFTAFSRQLAAIGILFVVSSPGCCLNGSVLRSFLFLFLRMYAGGPGGVIPFGPCEFSFAFCGSFAPC